MAAQAAQAAQAALAAQLAQPAQAGTSGWKLDYRTLMQDLSTLEGIQHALHQPIPESFWIKDGNQIIDSQWKLNQTNYVKSLSLYNLFIMRSYTSKGDRLANWMLRELPWGRKLLYQHLVTSLDEKRFPIHPLMFPWLKEYEIEIKPGDTFVNLVDQFRVIIKDHVDDSISKQKLNPYLQDLINLYIQDLNLIIDNAPKIAEFKLTYRGTQNFKQDGEILTSNDFRSTTEKKEVAKAFIKGNCCMYYVLIQPDTSALYLESNTAYPNEFEVLFPPNTYCNISNEYYGSYLAYMSHQKITRSTSHTKWTDSDSSVILSYLEYIDIPPYLMTSVANAWSFLCMSECQLIIQKQIHRQMRQDVSQDLHPWFHAEMNEYKPMTYEDVFEEAKLSAEQKFELFKANQLPVILQKVTPIAKKYGYLKDALTILFKNFGVMKSIDANDEKKYKQYLQQKGRQEADMIAYETKMAQSKKLNQEAHLKADQDYLNKKFEQTENYFEKYSKVENVFESKGIIKLINIVVEALRQQPENVERLQLFNHFTSLYDLTTISSSATALEMKAIITPEMIEEIQRHSELILMQISFDRHDGKMLIDFDIFQRRRSMFHLFLKHLIARKVFNFNLLSKMINRAASRCLG